MFRAVLINYTATITITPLNCMVITRANLYETNSFRKNCREPSGVTTLPRFVRSLSRHSSINLAVTYYRGSDSFAWNDDRG